VDITGESVDTITPDALARALTLFGDQSTQIVAWAMHSKPYFNLLRNAISEKIYGEANVVVYGGTPGTLGLPVVITDAALVEDDSSHDIYYTLGLTQAALECIQSEPDEITAQTVQGKANLIHRIQGEYAINYKMRGLSWVTGSGGTNPTAAEMATYTNWTRVFASNAKHLPGVCLISN
jgi:hypothetical protein